jgi:putative ABC transport system permease protein
MFAMKRAPIAWSSLTYDKRRLFVSVGGVALAVLLIMMQFGFRNAMFDSQVEIIRQLNADLVIISKVKYLLAASEPFPRRRLKQALTNAGVASAFPLYLESFGPSLKNPVNGSTHPIRVIAFNPQDDVFLFPHMEEYAKALRAPDTVLFDTNSKTTYGPIDMGTVSELSGQTIRVVGTFRLGTDFLTDGNLIMSDRNYFKLFPDRSDIKETLGRVEIGIVKVVPGARPTTVQDSLRQMLPSDVAVLTRKELEDLEELYWQRSTAIGFVFTLGAAVGFVVGVVICYQVLYNIVTKNLPQFATLKAIGYDNSYLLKIVLMQGIWLSLLGFLPGLLISQVLYVVIRNLTGLLMELTLARIGVVLVLSVAMCLLSAILAVRKAFLVDPAELY